VWNGKDKIEFLSNEKTCFILDQVKMWYRKLRKGKRIPEIEAEKRLLRSNF
jgi:hypothetical protein